MDVVKKIFEDNEVHNGSAVTRVINQTGIVLPQDYGANLSGLIDNLKDRFKKNDT